MAANTKIRGDRVFDTVCYILATFFLLIVLFPLLYILSCSISDPTYVGLGEVWLLPKGITFIGYEKVFSNPSIMRGYGNTIFYTVTATLLNLTLTLPAGYALSKKSLPGKGIFMVYLLITMYFSGGLIPQFLLVKNLNLLDTRLVLIIIGAVSVYNVIITRTFFQSIPSELEEAATIDGCSVPRLFLTIVLPLSKALIGVLTLYYGVGHWNSYFGALIYISDENKKPLQLILREILITSQLASSEADTQSAELAYETEKLQLFLKYSVIVVSSAPLLIVYPFLQKYFDKGVMLGSLKG
ncbi:MAG: carbohydrate ABC transporter permease [Ruminiclostridium sp.]|nr:carbohydrate ABC transporter permease [Ruminiclostridium sp.]